MSDAGLALTQFGYDQRVFWRNPMYVFFTVIQPLIFLVIFVEVFGNDTTQVGGSVIKLSTYYVPAIVSMSVVTATFFNLTIALTRMREGGILKRLRGTPLPPRIFLVGRVGTSLVLVALLVALVTGIGHVAYGVALPSHTLPGIALALLIGATAFSCLAFAVTSFVPTVDAAAPIVNVIMLPLLFISGVFIPSDQIPAGMRHVADLFPIKHLFDALLTGFDPATAGTGVTWSNLAVLAAWGLFGFVVALRRFRWSPHGTGA
jgi:ABC-2 type transport system permease protein